MCIRLGTSQGGREQGSLAYSTIVFSLCDNLLVLLPTSN